MSQAMHLLLRHQSHENLTNRFTCTYFAICIMQNVSLFILPCKLYSCSKYRHVWSTTTYSMRFQHPTCGPWETLNNWYGEKTHWNTMAKHSSIVAGNAWQPCHWRTVSLQDTPGLEDTPRDLREHIGKHPGLVWTLSPVKGILAGLL